MSNLPLTEAGGSRITSSTARLVAEEAPRIEVDEKVMFHGRGVRHSQVVLAQFSRPAWRRLIPIRGRTRQPGYVWVDQDRGLAIGDLPTRYAEVASSNTSAAD
jgi:hypothetical protein